MLIPKESTVILTQSFGLEDGTAHIENGGVSVMENRPLSASNLAEYL